MSMGVPALTKIGGLVGNDRVVPGGSVTYSYRSSGATIITIMGETENTASGTAQDGGTSC